MAEKTMGEIMARVGNDLLNEVEEITRFGFDRYHEISPNLKVDLDPRAQAACIYAFMMAEADRRFVGRTDMRLIKLRGLKVWAVDDHTLIRFKKMDKTGQGQNYSTAQAKEYDRGEDFAELPAPAVRLTAGYYPDQTATSILRVQIARPRGKTIDWCAAIIPAPERVRGRVIWENVTYQPNIEFA
jgi:hypothetical protein